MTRLRRCGFAQGPAPGHLRMSVYESEGNKITADPLGVRSFACVKFLQKGKREDHVGRHEQVLVIGPRMLLFCKEESVRISGSPHRHGVPA